MYHFCLLLIILDVQIVEMAGAGKVDGWPETMFWRQRKMNFENIFILPNIIGERSRRRFGGIFIKIPKVTFARSSLVYSQTARLLGETSTISFS